MSDTSIRISQATKRRLDLFKRDGESYEDVIIRLTERDKWAGFGALAGTETDTRTGMHRLRDAMRAGMTEDIEDAQ